MFRLLASALMLGGLLWIAREPAVAQEKASEPLPKDIVAAWEKAGATAGWVNSADGLNFIPGKGFEGLIPAFQFGSNLRPGQLRELPAPEQAFGLFPCPYLAEDAGMKEVAGLKQLQVLVLSDSKVTDTGLKQLADLKQLQTLVLVNTKVTDAGLKGLAGLKQLQVLLLSQTQITDAGLKELAGLKQLQDLDLSWSKVTDAGLKELAGLKQLRGLSLYKTQATDTGVKELQKTLPGCRIFLRIE